MIIQFEHLGLWSLDPEKRIDLPKVKDVFTRWQRALEGRGWNALFVENHDVPRIVSKWGDPERYWRESATSIATMYFLMQGTPFIYQGQELGMTNSIFRAAEDFQDVIAKNIFAAQRAEGRSDEEIIRELAPASRDNARTPMQWDSSPHAGFSRGTPWLRVNPNYPRINAAAQFDDPHSVFSYYRRLIALRKADPLWVYGRYQIVAEEHPQVYAYTRELDGWRVAVVCNLSDRPAPTSGLPIGKELLLTNYPDLPGTDHTAPLRPFEAKVITL
jgi:alpha-glucosidase